MCCPAGVLLNVLVPDWLQTALLTVLLLFVINKTVRKGITQWRQEQKAIKQKRSAAQQVPPRPETVHTCSPDLRHICIHARPHMTLMWGNLLCDPTVLARSMGD